MSTTSPTWRSYYHIVLLHPIQAQVLLLEGQEGWQLPSFSVEEPDPVSGEERMVEAVRRQLGVDTFVLYCAYRRRAEHEQERYEMIYVLEIREASWVPPAGAQWIGEQGLAHLELAVPEQRAVVAACLRETEDVPALRAAWARKGWLALAETWMREQLVGLNYSVTAPVEQVRTWGLSCVLRVPTTRGNVYFKAIPDRLTRKNVITSPEETGSLPLLFAQEPVVIQCLAAWFPQNVPVVLAQESKRCWMLLTDFGKELYNYPDKAALEQALVIYARLQIAAAQRIDALFAAGCLDRRLHVLESQIDPLLNDEEALADLSRDEIEQLRAHAPQLKAMCRQLADEAVPQTLVHGDLHSGNIAVQNGIPIFFDWTDSCIAHPFFDALTFLNLVNDPLERSHLLAVYLAEWTDYAPLERLQAIFPLSQRLAIIHQAVSYRHLMANMEGTTRQEMLSAAAYWLRKLLELMATTT